MKDNYTAAIEVIAGKYGNGAERRAKLEELGYNYNEVQSIVNSLVYDGMTGEQAAARLQDIPASSPESADGEYLEVDYDKSRYKGIIVNILM